ncbi:uncharacterized protein KY384_005152 [Bacidia gigantensis]|uniref:uncharacterized protein n=1 Tax=Bacidia gigantensis TaxID=2732470 RepID=UPI001D047BB7|nr:uncharacterized protein KY384_005152 [Bacidia gigantensis]KAG8529671.1 hypothetical protein KY384_005152 [Bacidia gigantensis]
MHFLTASLVFTITPLLLDTVQSIPWSHSATLPGQTLTLISDTSIQLTINPTPIGGQLLPDSVILALNMVSSQLTAALSENASAVYVPGTPNLEGAFAPEPAGPTSVPHPSEPSAIPPSGNPTSLQGVQYSVWQTQDQYNTLQKFTIQGLQDICQTLQGGWANGGGASLHESVISVTAQGVVIGHGCFSARENGCTA